MSKIAKMDAHLTNMIAAGEVVERPMGVVKELIENAMDAGAKSIEIHITKGGLEEINIIDDGCGMSASDASLAFERHATSKLHTINDLWKISTMGFRGEALPSIASVSHTYLKTNDGVDSTGVEIAYGTVKKAGPEGTPKGTQILVRNLFQKTPARLKHLKSYQYEFSLISDVVQKFALSRSDIAFTLTHDGKDVFQTQGRGNLLEVIMAIYGREIAKQAIALNGKDEDYEISGYAIQPSQTRASKYYMLCYINQRMIRSYRLQKAIIDAYAPYLPSDRYPIVVLNIKMDPKLVDVNVHPSKWEVRLSKEKQAEKLIYETISEALRNKLQVNKVERKEKVMVEMPKMEFTFKEPAVSKKAETSLKKENIPVKQENVMDELANEIREEFKVYQIQETKQEKEAVTPLNNIQEESITYTEEAAKVKEVMEEKVQETISLTAKEEIQEEKEVTEESKACNPSFPYMKVIGQLHGCYILAESEQGMYIIDQHAAQERYHYEKLNKQLLEGKNETQPLLVPLTIESTMSAVTQIDDINVLLSQIGITLEAFGNHTFIVRELPSWVCNVEEEKFLQDMIDLYMKNREVNIEKLRKHAIASMACHSSIRFNRNLTIEEMQCVVEDLKKCEQPFHCPHGRPTLIELTLKELEKDFYRVK